ncbi:MAG: HAMP domain-containing protein [Ruminococcaceae bacterium]|nr:HAMP domain-containing protein [Oscillospiraceae bacterium]
MIKKSIFSQLFIMTLSSILLSFLVLGCLLYNLMGSYLTEQKADDLSYVAENMASYTVTLARRNPGFTKEDYQISVDALSRSTDTMIMVLSPDGTVIAASTGHQSIVLPREFYADVMNGSRFRHFGTLGGVFNIPTLTVGVPIRFGDNAIVGGVFASLPIPEIHQLRSDIFRVMIMPFTVIMLVLLVIIYGVSRRLTKPLKTLKDAAKAIADGHLEQRVSLDVTNEIGELGDSFNKMADALQQQDVQRSDFIANISHDLRTPMTTITGFVEGILDGTIPPESQKNYLSIVLDETKRLSRLVTDLLDISKLEQGRFQIEKRNFDINEMIRLTIIKLEKRIMSKNIHLTVTFETENQRVWADKDAIQRVLTNLMDNAIKFTDENGFIDIASGTSDRNKVFVSIQNSGIGIEPENLAHVFERFYKSDKSRGLDKNGTGLGLFIVKNILTAHDETIWAESQPDAFTRFTFTLTPAQDEH